MGFGKTRIDPADTAFSWYVRLRDKRCVRCKSEISLNDKGLPNSHTNSHYFGRTCETTRFDLDNCDCVCTGCHSVWEERDKESYTAFKKAQLGEKRFQELCLRGRATMRQLGMRKDRKLQKIIWTNLLKQDFGVPV